MNLSKLKLLISLGGAIASTRIGRSLTDLDANDLLGIVGLSRRQSRFGEGLLLFSGGAVVGAGVALLFAPASGEETRRMIGERLEKVGDAASAKLRDLQEEVPALLGRDAPAQHTTPGQARKSAPGTGAHS